MIYKAMLWVVLLSALPFGAVLGWGWGTIALIIGVLLSAWGAAVLLGRQQVAAVSPRLLWAAIPFGAALGWGIFQTLPGVAQSLAHPLWASAASALGQELGQALGQNIAASISLDPAAGGESLVRLFTYGGVFWLALQAGRDRTTAHAMLYAIAMAGAAYALYGLIVYFTDSNTILWYDKTAYKDLVTGPFVNRNSFATFAGLGLVCTTAVLWHGVRHAAHDISSQRERRRLLLDYLLSRRAISLLSAWFILVIALLLSESRAGNLATYSALLVFIAIMLARGGGARRMAGTAGALLAVVVLLSFQLGGDNIDQRFTRVDADMQARTRYNEGTVRAIEDAPKLGTGLGSFESVFRFYDTAGPGMNLDKAHNDYLEIALELGLPAAGAFILSLIVLTAQCARGALKRHRDATIAAAGLAASTLVGIHSLVDFSLQMPAIALTYALILGIATAQSWGTRNL